MLKNYYIATNNKDKANEIIKILGGNNAILPNEIEGFIEPIEDGKTFLENSQKKADALYKCVCNQMNTGDLVIADDSGIIIPSLSENRLGVYTKREMLKWTQEQQKSEKDFWEYIYHEVGENAKAKFVVAITIIKSSGETIKIEESLEGVITSPKGTNGFAFDVIFKYKEKTFAERTPDEKQKINPRIKALEKALKYII